MKIDFHVLCYMDLNKIQKKNEINYEHNYNSLQITRVCG